jgi:phosphoribosyl 1,2-cyclic phosphodiesterase
MKLKFWGVRGSIPTPGRQTVRYGGNTPCVEVRPEPDVLFILDAGTGIHRCGDDLIKSGDPIRGYIFITHMHWDHIQGIPFFEPFLRPNNEFTIIGSDHNDVKLEQMLADQMKEMYFPLQFNEFKSHIEFKVVGEECFTVEGVQINTMYVNHPGYTLGYRLTYKEKSVVYISDNEPFDPKKTDKAGNKVGKEVVQLFNGNANGNPNSRVIEFIRNADVLIHDTMYTPLEYKTKELWGHSDYLFALDLAIRADVKNFYLFHHGPHHTDEDLDAIVQSCRAEVERRKHNLVCIAAAENMVVEL